MKRVLLCLLILAGLAFANTPGKRTVLLTWTASPTSGATYNIYRASSANVCAGNPTPYATGISGTQYVDQNVPAGNWFYNVSAVGTGGESTCDGEVQVAVSPITTQPPSGVSGVQQ